jgi:hypothetical protein
MLRLYGNRDMHCAQPAATVKKLLTIVRIPIFCVESKGGNRDRYYYDRLSASAIQS